MIDFGDTFWVALFGLPPASIGAWAALVAARNARKTHKAVETSNGLDIGGLVEMIAEEFKRQTGNSMKDVVFELQRSVSRLNETFVTHTAHDDARFSQHQDMLEQFHNQASSWRDDEKDKQVLIMSMLQMLLGHRGLNHPEESTDGTKQETT